MCSKLDCRDQFFVFIVLFSTFVANQFSLAYDNQIPLDLDYILDKDILPSKVFSEFNFVQPISEFINENNTATTGPKSLFGSNLAKAIVDMQLHRHMMTEYLLSLHLAKYLLSKEYEQHINNTKKQLMKSFMGYSTNGSNNVSSVNTYQDIKKHIELNSYTPNSVLSYTWNGQLGFDHENEREEKFDEGDITGYATAAIQQRTHVSPTTTYNKHRFYDGKNENGGYHSNSRGYSEIQSANSESVLTVTKHKEISLNQLTDIALSTLAFLSFGMFILHVILTLSAGKENIKNILIQSTELTKEHEELSVSHIDEVKRKRRSTCITSGHVKKMNQITRIILSLENAALRSPNEKENFYLLAICEGNCVATTSMKLNETLWIPIWSLAMSLINQLLPINYSEKKLNVLNSLKAIISGLRTCSCNKYKSNKKF